MKITQILSMVGLCVVASTGFASVTADKLTDSEAVNFAVHEFADGADAQDTAKVAKVLHAESMQYYMAPDGLKKIPQPVYLNLLKAKKVGGKPRTVKIHSVEVKGTIASAVATFDGGVASFDNLISLIKIKDDWQILSVVLRFVPKKK